MEKQSNKKLWAWLIGGFVALISIIAVVFFWVVAQKPANVKPSQIQESSYQTSSIHSSVQSSSSSSFSTTDSASSSSESSTSSISRIESSSMTSSEEDLLRRQGKVDPPKREPYSALDERYNKDLARNKENIKNLMTNVYAYLSSDQNWMAISWNGKTPKKVTSEWKVLEYFNNDMSNANNFLFQINVSKAKEFHQNRYGQGRNDGTDYGGGLKKWPQLGEKYNPVSLDIKDVTDHDALAKGSELGWQVLEIKAVFTVGSDPTEYVKRVRVNVMSDGTLTAPEGVNTPEP